MSSNFFFKKGSKADKDIASGDALANYCIECERYTGEVHMVRQPATTKNGKDIAVRLAALMKYLACISSALELSNKATENTSTGT